MVDRVIHEGFSDDITFTISRPNPADTTMNIPVDLSLTTGGVHHIELVVLHGSRRAVYTRRASTDPETDAARLTFPTVYEASGVTAAVDGALVRGATTVAYDGIAGGTFTVGNVVRFGNDLENYEITAATASELTFSPLLERTVADDATITEYADADQFGTDGRITFSPHPGRKNADGDYTLNPTFLAGDNGLHQLLFRLYTNVDRTKWFGVPDGEVIEFRVLPGGAEGETAPASVEGGAAGVPSAPANAAEVKRYELSVPISGPATWVEATGGPSSGPTGIPNAPANQATATRYELNVPATSGDATWVAAPTTAAAPEVQTLSFANTLTWNVDNGLSADLTLTGNVTVTLTGGSDSDIAILRVVQDSTGSRTLAFASAVQLGGRTVIIASAASARTTLVIQRIGTVWYYMGSVRDE